MTWHCRSCDLMLMGRMVARYGGGRHPTLAKAAATMGEQQSKTHGPEESQCGSRMEPTSRQFVSFDASGEQLHRFDDEIEASKKPDDLKHCDAPKSEARAQVHRKIIVNRDTCDSSSVRILQLLALSHLSTCGMRRRAPDVRVDGARLSHGFNHSFPRPVEGPVFLRPEPAARAGYPRARCALPHRSPRTWRSRSPR